MLTAYINLAKPKILALIVVASLCSAVVAGRGSLGYGTGMLLIVSGSLASTGAAFLNNYFDRDIDSRMERTKNRPLPLDRVNPSTVLVAGVTLIVVSLLFALMLNYLSGILFVSGALVYGFLYTVILKRRTSLNIVIGGLSGSCAILAGWFAVTRQVSAFPILAAVLVFLWTPCHFWSFALAHKESYSKANIPMLPVLTEADKTARLVFISTILTLAVSFLMYATGSFHWIYLAGSLIFGGLFLWTNVRFLRQPTVSRAWLNFKISGVYLLGLFIVIILDAVIH